MQDFFEKHVMISSGNLEQAKVIFNNSLKSKLKNDTNGNIEFDQLKDLKSFIKNLDLYKEVLVLYLKDLNLVSKQLAEETPANLSFEQRDHLIRFLNESDFKDVITLVGEIVNFNALQIDIQEDLRSIKKHLFSLFFKKGL